MKENMDILRTPIVAGNWKMHGDAIFARQLLMELIANYHSSEVQLIIFPPYVFLPQCYELLRQSNIAWGGQNMSEHKQGAYTGEISASMLADFDCRYVLLGHSERRQYYGEKDQMIVSKCQRAVAEGLIPIICVGETVEERRQGQTEQVLRQQLERILQLDLATLEQIIIAYEPVWAIGTGITATPLQAQETHAYIRRLFTSRAENIAKKLRILYGGSIKPDNAAAIFAEPDIDGGLIGGASLAAQSFLDIAKSWPN